MTCKKVTTRKATKVLGTQQFINRDTGEIQEMQVINIEERDANFHKLWIYHLAETLDLIGNQKTKILFHLIEKKNSDNLFIGTQRMIAEAVNVSLDSVTKTLKALYETDFLRVVQNGVYAINPDIVFKGGKNQRLNVLIQYQNINTETAHETKEKEVVNE